MGVVVSCSVCVLFPLDQVAVVKDKAEPVCDSLGERVVWLVSDDECTWPVEAVLPSRIVEDVTSGLEVAEGAFDDAKDPVAVCA